MENLSLGKRIASMRNALKMSQESLAKAIGVSRVAVTKWESGDTQNLKFHNLVSLLRIFRVTFDELVKSDTAISRHAIEARRLLDQVETDDGRDKILHAMSVAAARLRHDTPSGSSLDASSLADGKDEQSESRH